MGYDPASDNGAEQWRDVYWSLGQNLVDMNTKAEAEQRWDSLGVGYVLKAWGWQVLTDMHGEIIVKEAIDPTRFTFDYDTQEYAYTEMQRLLDRRSRTSEDRRRRRSRRTSAKTDKMYNGDRTKWLKLAYGLLALNLNHYPNKATYKPADVIAAVDKSFASNADDALLTYPGTSTDSPTTTSGAARATTSRSYRQTQFVVNLMNGTRLRRRGRSAHEPHAAPSPDGSVSRPRHQRRRRSARSPRRSSRTISSATPAPAASACPSRYIFDDKVEDSAHDVRAAAVHQGGSGATGWATRRRRWRRTRTASRRTSTS